MKLKLTLIGVLVAATACSGSGDSGTANSLVPPAAGVSSIQDIQGDTARSPRVGQVVTVEGIVTGDFQEDDADTRRNLGGFYMQAPPDGDAATSDGVFIYDGINPSTEVAVGDRVRVEGIVKEHFGETQINARNVVVTGEGSIEPVAIDLPATAVFTNSDGDLIADLEHLEGMLVRFPQSLTVTSLRNLERFGEIGLAAGGRPYQFTNQNPPGVSAYSEYRESVAARLILLDDGRRNENPTPIAWLTAGTNPDYSIRSGDEVADLTGNLRFSRGAGGNGDAAYRLMPTVDPVFDARNPPPAAPSADGELRVISINTLNWFSTVDSGRSNCGPRGDDGCRGADSARELDRQLTKLAHTLEIANADIIALVEVENNAGPALRALVAALNEVSPRDYAFVDAGIVGDDVITTGFIFDANTVAAQGAPAVLDSAVDARFNDDKNRPALAQAFRQRSNDAVVSVVVNHLKSKGSSCDDLGDPNIGDGQGNCNRTRTAAAKALADWVLTDPTDSGDPDYLVLGDLNAYLFEDPITALSDGGLVNLLLKYAGPDAYSFMFDAQIGALDHAFATTGLEAQVVAVDEWHINADEPRLRDYNLEFDRDPGLFDPRSPLRSSDHDPLIIGLDLDP